MKKGFICFILCAFIGLSTMPAYAAPSTSVLSTDIVTFIDMRPIASYNINNSTYIAAEDLQGYGFSVQWDGENRSLTVTRSPDPNANYAFMPKEGINVLKKDCVIGKRLFTVYPTDIRTVVGGDPVSAYNINGKTLINVNELERFGYISWNGNKRKIDVKILEKELGQQYSVITENYKQNYLLLEDTSQGYTASEYDVTRYIGEVDRNSPHGIGLMETEGADSCQTYNNIALGYFQNGLKHGAMLEKNTFHTICCINHFYTQYSYDLLQYENGQLNGYCLLTYERDDNYDNCTRTEGFYQDGQLNGWGRIGHFDDDYLYGFVIDEEGIYKNGLFSPLDNAKKLPAENIVSLNADQEPALITENGDYYVFQKFADSENYSPFYIGNGIQKRIHPPGDLILKQDGTLIMKNDITGELITVANGVKDFNSSCYLTKDGRLCNYTHATLLDNVKEISGNDRILALKNDGSVWYFRSNGYYKYQNSNWIDGKDLSKPIFIMDHCNSIFAGSSVFYAVKEDSTLYVWGNSENGYLLEASKKFPPSTEKEIPDDYLEADYFNVIEKKPVPILTNVKKIDAGNGNVVTLMKDDSLCIWGGAYATPETLTTNVKAFFASGNLYVALKKDGSVWIWNYDYDHPGKLASPQQLKTLYKAAKK